MLVYMVYVSCSRVSHSDISQLRTRTSTTGTNWNIKYNNNWTDNWTKLTLHIYICIYFKICKRLISHFINLIADQLFLRVNTDEKAVQLCREGQTVAWEVHHTVETVLSAQTWVTSVRNTSGVNHRMNECRTTLTPEFQRLSLIRNCI